MPLKHEVREVRQHAVGANLMLVKTETVARATENASTGTTEGASDLVRRQDVVVRSDELILVGRIAGPSHVTPLMTADPSVVRVLADPVALDVLAE